MNCFRIGCKDPKGTLMALNSGINDLKHTAKLAHISLEKKNQMIVFQGYYKFFHSHHLMPSEQHQNITKFSVEY